MKKNKRLKINLTDLVPIVAFIVILLVFSLWSIKDGKVRMLTANNLSTIIEQAMQTIVVASGTIFVVALGCVDMSVGVNLALSGVIGALIAYSLNIGWLMIPVAMVVGFIVGVFNGVMTSKFKISSFMQTIAMLIGVRGLVNYIQALPAVGTMSLPSSLSFLNKFAVKFPIFLVILVIMAYLFEFSRFGRNCRAIGENETAAKFVGIPVNKVKILAFGVSGLMAGVGSIFSIVTVGSTSMQMGVFLEMKVLMAIFLGGVLVTGGSSAKFYKILLGSLSIQIIINGLAIVGKSDVYISQTVEGILLLLVLFLSVYLGERQQHGRADVDEEPPGGITQKADSAAETA